MNRIVVCILCFAVFVCLTGCDKGKGLKTEYVEGVVTLDGEILADAGVRFIPVDDKVCEPAGGKANASGHYKLSSINGDPEKGAMLGEYKIVVSKAKITEYEENDPKAPKDAYGYPVRSTSVELVPKIYTVAKTTPLTYTVVKGKQTYNIELSTK